MSFWTLNDLSTCSGSFSTQVVVSIKTMRERTAAAPSCEGAGHCQEEVSLGASFQQAVILTITLLCVEVLSMYLCMCLCLADRAGQR